MRSEAAAEPLAGTASTIRHWLLVEHAGPWGRDPLRDGRMPAQAAASLRDIERISGARVLLIRRTNGARAVGGVTCFAADTAEPWLGRIRLDRIEETAGLDPRSRAAFETVTDPLIVVCTHGRRDPCCAELGRPLAIATSAAFPALTWESSHVGGDRFAANLVAFPHGLYFGRVKPEEGPPLVQALTEGRITLTRFRGRSSHPTYVQSADLAVRTALDIDDVEGTKIEHAEAGEGRAMVAILTPPAGPWCTWSVWTVLRCA